MNRAEVALAMGVSIRTIGEWERRGMPVRRPGGRGRGNGADYDLAACRKWAIELNRGQQMRNLIQARPPAVRTPEHPDIAKLLAGDAPTILGGMMAELGLGYEAACQAYNCLRGGLAMALANQGFHAEADDVAKAVGTVDFDRMRDEAVRIAADLLADWGEG